MSSELGGTFTRERNKSRGGADSVGWRLVTLDIMMPFYGRPDHFMVAVQSVLAQTSPDWRLTIIDDVYPDRAPGEWAAAISDPRVQYLRNEVNLRPSRNYNKAAELAQSEHMVLMGCDDVMLPGYIDRVTRLLKEHREADVVQPGVIVIDGVGRPTTPLADLAKKLYRPRGHRPSLIRSETLATSLLRGNWTYFPSLVWRTSLLRRLRFRTDLDVVQDLDMLLRITEGGGQLLLDDEVVFAYRRHRASLSATTGIDGSKFAQERTLFDEVGSRMIRLGWRDAASAARHHVSSRLNAVSEVPGALLRRDGEGLRALARHAVGTRRGPSRPDPGAE